jgi:hypothetical protein
MVSIVAQLAEDRAVAASLEALGPGGLDDADPDERPLDLPEHRRRPLKRRARRPAHFLAKLLDYKEHHRREDDDEDRQLPRDEHRQPQGEYHFDWFLD